MMTLEPEFRPLSENERRILDRLLEQPFTGRDELLAQVASAMARRIDPEGSIELQTTVTTPSPVVLRVPVEASLPDTDGITVRILLHVVNGIVKELEVYKDDGSPIQRQIDAEALTVSATSD